MLIVVAYIQFFAILGVDNLIECVGDRKELMALYVQLLANENQFPRGEAKIVWKFQTPDNKVRETVECLLKWDGERTGWDWESVKIYPGLNNSKPTRSTLRRLLTPGGDHIFVPGKQPRYESSTSQPRSLGSNFALRPDQLWYGSSPTLPWSQFFIREKFPPNVFRCELKTEGDLLILQRVNIAMNLRGAFTFSRAVGGNMVSSFFGDVADAGRPAPSEKAKSEYDWVRLPDGRWRLKRLFRTVDRPPRKDGSSNSEVFEVLVESFNPNPDWGSQQLTPEGFFKVPDNAVVSEKTPAGTRRYRKVHQDALPQDRLDSLVQSLKARGFALPKAKTKD